MKKSLGAKTIVFPTPVLIVGSYDKDGNANIMNAAWGGICCSVPPCISVSIRAATYTYHNIKERGAFTVSIPSENYVVESDYAGMVSGRSVNKFEATGLTPVRSEIVDAPYVGEFPLVIECKLAHAFELGLHTMFVGEILDVKAEDNTLQSEGYVDVLKVKPFWFAPDARKYYTCGDFLADAFSVGSKLKDKANLRK